MYPAAEICKALGSSRWYQLTVRAKRTACREHASRIDSGYFKSTPLYWQDAKIENITLFDHPMRDGDIGEVEITYDREGHRALYGFDTDLNLSIYAD